MVNRIIFITYITWTVIWTNNVWAAQNIDKSLIENKDVASLYTKHCAICHGDKGDGNTRAQNGLNPPPRDFTTVQSASELTRERMIDSVSNGRPGTGMMPHKDRLSPSQISSLVDYIRGKFMRTAEISSASVADPKGAKIYTKFCAVCHGDNGGSARWAQTQMSPPPRDFTSEEAARLLSRERMITSVTNGRPGTGMMSFTTKLDRKEIETVVDYIRERFLGKNSAGQISLMQPEGRHPAAGVNKVNPHQTGTTGGTSRQNPHAGLPGQVHAGMPMAQQNLPPVIAADMTLPMPRGLRGNVAKGRQFFMKNCFTCHGVKGDGNGPRAYFNIPRPRNFTSDASRRMLNRVRLFNSISDGRVGTVMPAWGKVLNNQQIADVAEFVFETFIRQKAGSNKKKAR